MKIFVLEDDYNCKGVISWLRGKSNVIKVVETIEDAYYYVEYENAYQYYDKFILDASLPGASVICPDGTEKEYNGALNGIDFVIDTFLKSDADLHNITILTAFATQVEAYLKSKGNDRNIRIINKNDNDLTRRLQDFLDS
ncbi:MAG: hypothetical protein NC489_12720 [Ruminococcus flavefaciens]|nr:hypothetical protein [Ruminococcus flavefaciens]